MKTPGSDAPYGTYYCTGPGQRATENLEGDDSRIIMDRAIPFIRDAVGRQTPFFALIWFHTPCSTCDYIPTILDVLGLQPAEQPKPIDGVSLLPAQPRWKRLLIQQGGSIKETVPVWEFAFQLP
jgi:hypothetical protein